MSEARIEFITEVYKQIGGRATNIRLVETHYGPATPTKQLTIKLVPGTVSVKLIEDSDNNMTEKDINCTLYMTGNNHPPAR